MALNLTGSQLTELDSLTAHSQDRCSDSIRTGQYFRWNGGKFLWAPPFRRCLILSLVFLFRGVTKRHQRYGGAVAKLSCDLTEVTAHWRARWHLKQLKWRMFRLSLSNTVQRMFWLHTLQHYQVLGQIRMWMNHRRAMSRIKTMFRPSQRKTAQLKYRGKTDGIA